MLEMGQFQHWGNLQQELKVLKHSGGAGGAGLEADIVGLGFNFTECHKTYYRKYNEDMRP